MENISQPNKSRRELIFCSICLDEFEISAHMTPKLHKIQKCSCTFCRGCLKQYITTEIMSRKQEIACPDPLCHEKGRIQLHEIKTLVPWETFEKYEEFKTNYKGALDRNRTWCPAPNCNTICSKSNIFYFGNPNFIGCPSCKTPFCFGCSGNWHPNSTCSEDITEDEATIKNIKRCPKCKILIEKDGGCTFIKCKQCKSTFCWDCSFISKKYFSMPFFEDHPVVLDNCKCRQKPTEILGFVLSFIIVVLWNYPGGHPNHMVVHTNHTGGHINDLVCQPHDQDMYLMTPKSHQWAIPLPITIFGLILGVLNNIISRIFVVDLNN